VRISPIPRVGKGFSCTNRGVKLARSCSSSEIQGLSEAERAGMQQYFLLVTSGLDDGRRPVRTGGRSEK
jgi:hypothetical protein